MFSYEAHGCTVYSGWPLLSKVHDYSGRDQGKGRARRSDTLIHLHRAPSGGVSTGRTTQPGPSFVALGGKVGMNNTFVWSQVGCDLANTSIGPATGSDHDETWPRTPLCLLQETAVPTCIENRRCAGLAGAYVSGPVNVQAPCDDIAEILCGVWHSSLHST